MCQDLYHTLIAALHARGAENVAQVSPIYALEHLPCIKAHRCAGLSRLGKSEVRTNIITQTSDLPEELDHSIVEYQVWRRHLHRGVVLVSSTSLQDCKPVTYRVARR